MDFLLAYLLGLGTLPALILVAYLLSRLLPGGSDRGGKGRHSA